jgi:hypothetical protein
MACVDFQLSDLRDDIVCDIDLGVQVQQAFFSLSQHPARVLLNIMGKTTRSGPSSAQ